MVTAAAPCAKPKTDAATTQDIRSLFMNFPSFEWLTTLQYNELTLRRRMFMVNKIPFTLIKIPGPTPA
jgi:hypothetical protein